MPVLAGRGSNLAKHTYESKINLAKGGPDFASFAKFGDKIANLATLPAKSNAHISFEGFWEVGRSRKLESSCGRVTE